MRLFIFRPNLRAIFGFLKYWYGVYFLVLSTTNITPAKDLENGNEDPEYHGKITTTYFVVH